MKQVIKRDGKEVKFNLKKIVSAIRRAGESSGEFGYDEALDLTNSVIQMFDNKEKATVEEIQDAVEKVLNENNYTKTARAFIVYREKHNDMRKDNNVMIDAVQSIDDYLDRSDWRVNANANQGYSLGGMILNTSGKVTANYWLSHVYPKEAGEAHRNGDIQIHDLDMLANYCTGWSLRALLQEGFNGVKGKVESNPPKHLASALGQMVNFWGCLQNENAGAQAFSSFDTYLAPYVRNDKLTYKQVYDAIQEFVFNVNVPSRWGCVPNTTKVLSIDGWKSIDELSEDDVIYTWKNGSLNTCKVNGVCRKKFKGSLISFINTQYGYEQTVTPTHRTLVSKTNKNVFDAEIVHAEEIESDVSNKYWKFPTEFKAVDINTKANFSNDEIALAAMIYTDGNLDFRKENVHKVRYLKSEKRLQGLKESGIDPELIFNNLGLSFTKTEKVSKDFGSKMHVWNFYGDSAKKIVNLVKSKYEINKEFYKLNKCQADLFLHVWELHDGDESRHLLQVDNELIFEQLAHIAVLSGHVVSKKLKKCKSGKYVTYVSLTGVNGVSPKQISRINYDDMVWCPNVADGTAIFMNKDGGVFISGQTQTPFTNITLDWTCPEDLKDSQPIIAGEEMDYTYSELQPEMDMINKAFIEVMIKGDAHGRLFTFPIPTYNITPDFPWGSENTKLLFEMTAKYGLPYFQNFLNSDLKVGDVRSMCPLTGDTEIWCRTTKGTHKLQIQEMYRNFHRGLKYEFYEVWDGYRWCKASVNKQYDSKVYEITLGNGDVVKMGSKHLQYVPELKSSITAEYLKVGMFLPYNSKPMNIDVVEGSKLAGEIVGIFAGDGSFDGDGVVFSLSSEMKDDETEEKIRSFFNPLGIVVLKRVKGGLRTLWVGKGSADFIRRFISGTALNKKFEKKVFTLSNSFLEGVLNGFRLTDGSRSRSRLYTSSRFLVNDLVSIASLVGRKHSVVYEDKREGRLGENVNYRVDLPLRESYGDLFKCIDNFDCYPIKKISLISDNKKPLYCLEVQNDSHLFTLANGLLTHNCRLQLDLREIKKRGGGLFGSGEQTGSIGVITINCARLGYLFKNDITGLYKRLDELMNIARNALEQKRKSLNKWMEQGLYPYSKRYLGGYNTLFSTIGINGVNEMIRNFTNDEHDITDDYGQKFAMSLMDHINEVLKQFQVETGNLYNLEATPGEGTTFRFAKEDKKRYPDIIQAGKPEAPYYTNSTQIPVGYTNDPFTALNLQEGLQRRYSGGTVIHLYMGEAMSSSDSCKTLVKRVLENYHIPYLTITPTFSICPKHGYISGEHKYCPICDEELTSPKQEQCKACKC